jgi:Ca-activated chloride channel family protein
MKPSIISFFLLLSSATFAQSGFIETKHNLGTLLQHSDRFADFYYINRSTSNIFLLRIDKPMAVSSLFNKEEIKPGDTLVLRLQVNPKETGNFSYTVNVYLSNSMEALPLQLTGNTKELSGPNALTACPDFNQTNKNSQSKFDLTVITVEKGSGKPLSNSIVSFVQNGTLQYQNRTGKNGTIHQKGELGYFYFYARHEAYYPAETGSFVNPNNNYIVLKLERDTLFKPVIADTIPVFDDTASSIVETRVTILDTVYETSAVTSSLSVLTQKTDTLQEHIDTSSIEENLSVFDTTHFKPNNLVFVLDVSMSMRAEDKMELMKYALLQLADYIREEDKICIVSYASYAAVILPTCAGNQKDKIKNIVGQLKGGGFTAGGTGIKLGYHEAKNAYLKEGNNEVIVITDGAFNRDSEDYKKVMKKYTKKGYVLSIVGIKNNPKDELEMEEVAKIGNGRYIPIFKLADAQWNLIREIRQASYKGK